MFNILISKADKTLPIDWDAMPDVAKRHIIEYGLRQKLNDAGSQFKKGEENFAENALGAAENVLAALMEGRIRVVVAQGSNDKALRKFALALAAHVKAGFENDDSLDDLLIAIADKTDKPTDRIRAALQKQVDAEAALKAQIAALKAAAPAVDLDL